jgi:D-alanyl-D-alanine carboxypeptidase/D-alanyl-D-alanine-endopeptidase (penicillin-binding protein 4)
LLSRKAFNLTIGSSLATIAGSITGSVIADGSGFSYDGVPDGWSWNDIGNYYGAGPSGICLFDNMVSYYYKTVLNYVYIVFYFWEICKNL